MLRVPEQAEVPGDLLHQGGQHGHRRGLHEDKRQLLDQNRGRDQTGVGAEERGPQRESLAVLVLDVRAEMPEGGPGDERHILRAGPEFQAGGEDREF